MIRDVVGVCARASRHVARGGYRDDGISCE